MNIKKDFHPPGFSIKMLQSLNRDTKRVYIIERNIILKFFLKNCEKSLLLSVVFVIIFVVS